MEAIHEEAPAPSTALALVEVEGWTLGRLGGDEEPRIRDIDLAERLGYAQPRDIRKLVKRMEQEGKITEIHVRATVARTSMPRGGFRTEKVDEFWLTEGQALKVAAKSETEVADALLDEMVHVFMLARRGELPGQRGPSREGMAIGWRSHLERGDGARDGLEHLAPAERVAGGELGQARDVADPLRAEQRELAPKATRMSARAPDAGARHASTSGGCAA